MIMGDKIVKVEDAFITIGGYILAILKDKNMSVDLLYSNFSKEYPKKINFDDFIYAIDFLFMIRKIKIKNDDILEVVI